MFLLGAYHTENITLNILVLSQIFAISVMSGIIEEIIYRGIPYKTLEKYLGNATLFSALAIAIESGLLLGICYTLTTILWFVMSIHIAWNFFEGGIFGAKLSGMQFESLLEAQFTENPL